MILDDIRISADEKHFFKGLSKLKGINDLKLMDDWSGYLT